MELTFVVTKLETQGEHNAVNVIHYTVSGTDDNGDSATLERTIGFKLADGTADNYIAFNNVTQANALAWLQNALTPPVKDDLGNTLDIDTYPEVKLGIEIDIKSSIAKAATNLPWE